MDGAPVAVEVASFIKNPLELELNAETDELEDNIDTPTSKKWSICESDKKETKWDCIWLAEQ